MMAQHVMEDNKILAIYFYQSDDQVSQTFKALSAVSVLKDKMVFMALQNPSENLVK
jgi:ribosome maturation protein Sdo1